MREGGGEVSEGTDKVFPSQLYVLHVDVRQGRKSWGCGDTGALLPQ